MRRKPLIISLIIIVLIICGYLTWDITQIGKYEGEYVSVDAKDSLYELTVSKTGHVSIADVGAGNSALEGLMYVVPDPDNQFRIKTFGETDKTFLGLENNKLRIRPAILGQTSDDQAAATLRVIIFEASDSMQFNEKGYE